MIHDPLVLLHNNIYYLHVHRKLGSFQWYYNALILFAHQQLAYKIILYFIIQF